MNIAGKLRWDIDIIRDKAIARLNELVGDKETIISSGPLAPEYDEEACICGYHKDTVIIDDGMNDSIMIPIEQFSADTIVKLLAVVENLEAK